MFGTPWVFRSVGAWLILAMFDAVVSVVPFCYGFVNPTMTSILLSVGWISTFVAAMVTE